MGLPARVAATYAFMFVLFGTLLYAGFTFVWTPTHYIHLMVVTLGACIAFALGVNRLVFGKRAVLVDSVRARLGLKPG